MNPAEPVGIVAGSGLDLRPVLDHVEDERAFGEFPGLPTTEIAGHAGRFVLGRCGRTPVVLQLGRVHVYEGHELPTVTRAVEVLHELGVRTLICTNAAGGLDPSMEPGHLMAAARIRLWPYRRWPSQPEQMDPDFVVGHCDWTGPYCWVHGPCYETRAEIRALQSLDARAVGMSTAPEIYRAQQLGMRAAAVSCITNNCCTPHVLTHEHVLRTAQAASSRLRGLLRGAIEAGFGDTKPARKMKAE